MTCAAQNRIDLQNVTSPTRDRARASQRCPSVSRVSFGLGLDRGPPVTDEGARVNRGSAMKRGQLTMVLAGSPHQATESGKLDEF